MVYTQARFQGFYIRNTDSTVVQYKCFFLLSQTVDNPWGKLRNPHFITYTSAKISGSNDKMLNFEILGATCNLIDSRIKSLTF